MRERAERRSRSRGRKPICALPHTIRVGRSGRPPGALKVIDSMLGALLDAGLGDVETVRAYRSLTGLAFGAALTEETGLAGAPLDRAEPVDDWFRRMATPSETPHLHRLLPVLTDADCRQDFETQLDLLVSALGKAGN
nr:MULTISPECIES: TetR/AcrR family transcriptional regulator C-terminal domain-containing protein [Actinomycetes]